MKKALFLEHDHLSIAGPIWQAFESEGYEIERFLIVPEKDFLAPNVSARWPNFSDFDVIVPMGSPWGVWEDERIGNWLLPELELVKKAHNDGIPIFGICFGGQLMARALGGSVARAPRSEIGWHYILSDTPSLIPAGPWFQYHWDRWTLPRGATEIARTPIASQAFTFGRTFGMQFHPEIDSEVLEAWLSMEGGCAEVEGEGLNVEVLRAQTKSESPAAIARAKKLVEVFLHQIATSPIKPVA